MAGDQQRIDVLDYARALAIIHIVMYHYYVEWFGGSFLIEPAGIVANLERLQIFDGGGFSNVLKNLFSFLFVYGFSSVNLFLALSGFVLTYTFLKGGEFTRFKKVGDWVSYYWKRYKRLLIPFYLSVLAGMAFLFGRNILFSALGGPAWLVGPPLFGWLDALKLLFVPFLFYDIQFLQLFNGDYWFIPLIFQLYLLFPLLYWVLKRARVRNFLIVAFVVSVAFRFSAAYFLSSVPMGVLYPAENSYRLFGFFLPRLFEFAFGMGLAAVFVRSPKVLERMEGFWPLLLGLALTLGGFVLNMYQWGWAFSDPVLGVGLLLVFMNVGMLLARRKLVEKFLKIVSDSAYELFLLHHYFLNYFLLPLLVTLGLRGMESTFWIVMPLYFILSIALGAAGRRLSLATEQLLSRSRNQLKDSRSL